MSSIREQNYVKSTAVGYNNILRYNLYPFQRYIFQQIHEYPVPPSAIYNFWRNPPLVDLFWDNFYMEKKSYFPPLSELIHNIRE